MSGWHSLSGYLHYRTKGALSMLKPKKRLWFVFEESQCQFMFYNSENDARKKPAVGQICLKGAAISLDLEQHNQFVIIAEKKDHVFTTENHESLMIWLIGLQAKRDACINRMLSAPTPPTCSLISEDVLARKRRSCDWSTLRDLGRTNGHESLRRSNTMGNNNGRHIAFGHRPLRQADSCSLLESADKAVSSYTPNRSRSLPPLIEVMCESNPVQTRQLSRSVTEEDLGSDQPPDDRLWLRRDSNSSVGSLSAHEDNDDVFGEHCSSSKSAEEKLKMLRHKHGHVEMMAETSSSKCNSSSLMNGYERTSSCSGLSSGSTDSAIDKSTSDPHQEILSRMADLEQELISTKCELAKVLNQQTFFQEVLEKKDAIINELDQTLDQLGVADIKRHLLYGGKFLTTKKGKILEERVRVLQNQNRFLNEEVKRLAKNRHGEQDRFREQEERLRGYEAEIEGWKRNYVSIVQSCIHYPTGDAMDGADVTLFGEDMHKVTIKGLLTEARRTNPSLPTFERLASSPHHVDQYGFRHNHENTGILLHYICQQLNQHYTMQLANYEEHQLHWKEYLCEHREFTRSDKELKELCRGGIPHQYRKEVWRRLVYTQVQDLRKEKGCHFYRNLCNSLPDSQLAARYRKQISLDLMRTMPSNVKFSSASSKGIHDLQDVLLAFCIHNPSVGYCQGLNFIVAMALLIMEPQDAFWTLIAVTEKYFSPNYFNHNLIGAQADQEVLREIIHDKLPKLYQHLEDIDIEISTVTLNWFMAIFFDAVPFETLLRLWDCFLLEGPKVLFRFSLSILKMHESELLQKSDTISVMRHLKACAKLTYDADRLIKTAFEDLGPFPSRRDISVKQTCYLNVLKEKYKKREWHKRAYVEREQMLLEQKADTENAVLIECVAAYDEGKVWLCHTQDNVSNVCKVNCSENMMYNLSLQFEARILCMKALREDIMLIGTVAWTLFAYDTRSREEKWHVQLHDAVLCLCVHKEGRHRRVFAGLADGTVAVLENVRSSPPKSDVYYVPVGKSSVTSIVVFNNQLWCASGNMVYVLHCSNLDPMDNFTVSANPYDQVLMLVPGDYGMWISLKGSSILELWDTSTLTCKMLYDTRSGRYPNLRKEDDSYFNKARITSVLANDSTVIVGTGDGVMITFEVVEKNPLKSSPDSSSCSESRSSSPFWIQGHKGVTLTSDRESQEKVKDYFRRLDSPQGQTSSALETTSCDSVTDFSIDDQMSKRFQDFGNMSYPSSLACSEISTDFFNQDNNSVQNKGDNYADSEQGEVILASEDETESFENLESSDLPSGSTPTAEKEVLILADIFCDNMSDIDDANNGNLNFSEGRTRQNMMTSNTDGTENNHDQQVVLSDESNRNAPTKETTDTLDNFTPTQSSMDYDCSKRNSNYEDVVETDFTNNVNNNNVPKICVENEMCKGQEDNLGNEESSEDPSFMTSVTSSESFRSCESKEEPDSSIASVADADMPADQITEENRAENSPTETFFEDDVFYEAITGSSHDLSKTTDMMVPEFKRTSSPIPEKEKSKSRLSRFRRRPKKLNSEVQYRLDFSDIKVSIDSTRSSSSDKRSPLLSNFYTSDSSLDQLKSSGRGDHSFNMFSKSESKLHVDMDTKPPVVIKAEKNESGQFGILAGFKRVCSLDTHMDSVGLSSLDDVSSYKESSETKGRLTVTKPQISHNSSCTSLCSLTEAQLYSFDLNLQAKVKISDKPVKCLLPTSVKEEPIIISCAGSYGDDEAVLRWRREPDEKIWTNEPIYEICERTHQARLPSYMLTSRRLSSVSSIHSGDSQTSVSSVIATGTT